jgi:hypothetical protein
MAPWYRILRPGGETTSGRAESKEYMTHARARLSLTFVLIGAVYATSIAITRSALWAQAPTALGLGVTLDLTLTVLALATFLAVRPGLLPRAALVPLFVVGLASARLIVPADGREGLAALAALWVVAEVALLALLVARAGRVARAVRAERRAGATPIAALEQALAGVLGARLGSMLAVELGALGYAAAGWMFSSRPGFSMHRERRWGMIVGVLGFLVVVETAGLHLALARLSPVVAWVATALSAYGLAWLAGDYQALRLVPLVLEADALRVEVGLRWRLRIPRADLVSATAIDSRPAKDRALLDAGVMTPNVLLTLAAPATARGPFGLSRAVTRVALTVDRRDAFLAALAHA